MDAANDPFSLEGKRILVTGASSGIGRQTAISCAEMGAQLVITGRDQDRLDATLATLAGTGHTQVVADLTQGADLNRVLDAVGMVHGVVHAAGVSRLVPLRMVTSAYLESTFASNTFAPILLTKGLQAKKHIAPGGSVVFITALAMHTGPMASSVYAASKGALMGAMRVLGREVVKQGIRANSISPGYVRTPLLDGLSQGGAQMDAVSGMAPLGIGEPEDIAHAVVYFLSDASRWVTRNHFIIDGGLTASSDIFA